MRPFIAFLFSIFIVFGQAQPRNQAEYLEAKRQFSLGNYSAAKLAFQSLSQDKTFGIYASFYYALSAHKNGETQLAYDMWRQIQISQPKWDQKREVNYWLANTAFELEKYSVGFQYLAKLPKDLRQGIIDQTIGKLSSEELTQVYESDADSKELASYLANSIMQKPYGERDQDLLQQLSEKFDIELVSNEANLPEIKKEKYTIAAILPFMFDSIQNPQPVLRNSIIWDLYQGMGLAKEELSKQNIEVVLFPFDTKKRRDVTSQLIRSGELKNTDVVVGPLYSGPNEVMAEYSANQKITMINPLSSNNEIVVDNSFSYLFKPSYQTQGRAAANYAKENFSDNKKAFIFYESDRDSLVARTYLDEIEKDGFFVIRFERMTNASAQQVQKDFTEKYEVRLDTMFSRKEMDSISLLPGRIVKERPLRLEGSGTIVKDSDGNPVTEYYEERFNVVEDSIGHIFVASSSNLLVNNFISLAEVRNDTIGLIGYDDWLGFPTISYSQLERLGIAFVSPSLFDKDTDYFKDLEQTFVEKIGREPGEYHLIGYELMYQLGQLLDKYGKYFQRGLHGSEKVDGKVMYGLQYGQFHDNQIVPISKLENLELVSQDMDKEKKRSED